MTSPHVHLHLDPVGGIAGDMFAAAMLDAFPALGEGLVDALRRAGLAADVSVRWQQVEDEVLAGSRFVVDDPREKRGARPAHAAIRGPAHGHALAGHAHGEHAHVPFTDVRRRIEESGLAPGVVARALDIFLRLARAEAEVHGFADADAVVFHEVGAMDSVADVVAAAWLVEGVARLRDGARVTWSCGALPLGSGTVDTAHGVLPVPTPATAILLRGLPVHDDGRPGERVTPTGAAIVQHLLATAGAPRPRAHEGATLGRTGTGWGTKRFAGLPNVVRVVELAREGGGAAGPKLERDVVSVLSFEVDDQSGEDLAVGLEHVRAHEGVLDVLQAPAFGKKGRMVAQVRVLAHVDAEDAVVAACLRETTTLGVRVERQARVVLARQAGTRDVDGRAVRTKTAERPGGATTKVESDDLATLPTASARARVRRRAEEQT